MLMREYCYSINLHPHYYGMAIIQLQCKKLKRYSNSEIVHKSIKKTLLKQEIINCTESTSIATTSHKKRESKVDGNDHTPRQQQKNGYATLVGIDSIRL